MAFRFLLNQTPQTFAECIFLWKEFMKSPSPDGPGWRVRLSSMGSGYTSFDDGDILTSPTLMSNPKSWFILQAPNGDGINGKRELLFQVGSSTSEWRVKYSRLGFLDATSATAEETPTSVSFNGSIDEAVIYGGGTNISPTMQNLFSGLTEGSFVFNAAAQDSDGYGAYFFAYPKTKLRTSNGIKTMFILDPLKTGTYNQEDIDPVTIYIGNSPGQNTAYNMTVPSNYSGKKFMGYVCRGISGMQKFVPLSIASWGSSSNEWAPGSIGSANHSLNPHSSYEDLCPVLYFYVNGGSGVTQLDALDPSQSYKGTSDVFYIGSSLRSNGDYYNYNGDYGNKIYINGFAFPWNNTAPIP